MLLEVLIAFADQLLQVIPRAYRVFECEQVLIGVLASQIFGDRGLALRATVLAHPGQLLRVTLSCQDGANDPHPRLSRDICDRLVNPDVHLRERFFHVLDLRRRLSDQSLTVAVVGAVCRHRHRWTMRAPKQTKRVQQLDPLAVQHVGLLMVVDPLEARRFGQQHFDPTGFQHFQQRNAIHPCCFHGHALHPALDEPIGKLVKTSRVRQKLSGAGAFRAVLWHRSVVILRSAIHSARVLIHSLPDSSTLLPGSGRSTLRHDSPRYC